MSRAGWLVSLAAHVLTVLYYRLTDPDRPVIDPDVLRWESVWVAPTAEG